MTHNHLLADLNTPQQQAVTASEKAIMILAGAGSGKTRVLTRRMAYLLEQKEINPEEVLAVTFTNKAAQEMRERVTELLNLNETHAYRLWIGTFHGMGARILRAHAALIGFDAHFVILDSSDQMRLIKRLTEQLDFVDSYWTPKRLVNSISRWKDDGLAPMDLDENRLNFSRDRKRIIAFYEAYQDELLRINAMDFGDLLANCLKLWQRVPEILINYQRRFRHILVDEYQDTNKIQYEWMRLLSHDCGLCVVGDDDQSIYSWRGARLDNMLKFEDDFPGARIIRLEQNYRSTGTILKASGALIDHNLHRKGKTLWTEGEEGPPLEIYIAEDGENEARYVTLEILRLCPQNQFHHVAVLVRTSSQTRLFEQAFNENNIPYRVSGGLRFMDRAEIKDAVCYLRLAYSFRDDMAFERIINNPSRKLGPKALELIGQAAQEQNGSLLDGVRVVIAKGEMGPAATLKLQAFVTLMDECHNLLETLHPTQILDKLLTESGYNEMVKKDERAVDKEENLNELKTFLSKMNDIPSFLERAALEADPPGSYEEENAVNRVVISTLHAAKGLEFPTVFLVGLEEGLLPHKMAILEGGNAAVEEERRLTYVGMTRAKEKLYLCHARSRRIFQFLEPAIPSRFLKELPQETLHKQTTRFTAQRGIGKPRQRRAFSYR